MKVFWGSKRCAGPNRLCVGFFFIDILGISKRQSPPCCNWQAAPRQRAGADSPLIGLVPWKLLLGGGQWGSTGKCWESALFRVWRAHAVTHPPVLGSSCCFHVPLHCIACALLLKAWTSYSLWRMVLGAHTSRSSVPGSVCSPWATSASDCRGEGTHLSPSILCWDILWAVIYTSGTLWRLRQDFA